MKLSEGVEWSIHMCTLLAALPPQVGVAGKKLAEFYQLPKPYLAKHLQALARADILAVRKGPGGGYFLARAPQDISLFDILKALGEAEPSFKCTEIRQRGPSAVGLSGYGKPCAIASAMGRADRRWAEELKSTSVAELAEAAANDIDPEQAQKAAIWFSDTLPI